MSGGAPIWAQRIRHIIRGGASARLADVAGASAAAQWSVLVALADLALDDGTLPPACEPTAATIGVQCLMSERTSRRALHALAGAGLITATRRDGGATTYALTVDAIEPREITPHRWGGRAPVVASPRTSCQPCHGGTPAMVTGEGGHGGRGTPDTMTGDPCHGVPPTPYRIGEGSSEDSKGEQPEASLASLAPIQVPTVAANDREQSRKPRKPARGEQATLIPTGPTVRKAARTYPYVSAFDEGQQEASGQPFITSDPGRWNRAAVDAARAHAPELRGEAVTDWIRETSAAWRRARPSQATFGGYTPAGMLAWLNSGRPGEPRRGPAQAPRQQGAVAGCMIEF